MTADPAVFESMKSFLKFDDDDARRLAALRPLFEAHGGAITDTFYERLAAVEQTAKLIEGRVAHLKGTHRRWMMELFAGDYGPSYFENRLRIGEAHVRIGLEPWWVEGVMSFLRTASAEAIAVSEPDAGRAAELHGSLCKLLDLDLLVINMAYAEERLDRLTRFTGLSRRLIERCIIKG
jgi:hypothetical protein